MRLFELAHSKIKENIKRGDFCIDATLGNGYDSLFLAQQISPHGRVFAMDIQQSAIHQARCKLDAAGLAKCVTIIHDCHTNIMQRIPVQYHGEIAIAMYNLGYLPGGDHSIKTTHESTINSLLKTYELLKPGGLLSVLCYRGHDGGAKESDEVGKLCSLQNWSFEKFQGSNDPVSPVLIVIRKS